MNNFNALNHHIASLNHAISSLNKSHQELSMKVNGMSDLSPPSEVESKPDADVIKKLVDESVSQAKSELLNSIESLINSLDIDKKIEDAMAKVKSDIDQAIDVDITLPEPPMLDEPTPVEDDILFESIKEEKPKTIRKKSTKRQT